MTEVNTFSAIVDDTVTRTGRVNLRTDIVSYARVTMRESQSLIKSATDLIEDQITATASPHLWTKPQYFRELTAVRYPGIFDPRGNPIYPKRIQPGKAQRNVDYYFYSSGTSFVFSGVSENTLIDVAYLTWFTKLAYYATVAERPATFSLEDDEWSYATATTDEEKEAARNLVTNWLIFDWYDMVLEGTVAKVWKAVGDARAPSSFSLFKSLQKDMVRTVTPDSYDGD